MSHSAHKRLQRNQGLQSTARALGSPPRSCIPWRPSPALRGDSRPEKTIRLEGELASVRREMAGYLKELGI